MKKRLVLFLCAGVFLIGCGQQTEVKNVEKIQQEEKQENPTVKKARQNAEAVKQKEKVEADKKLEEERKIQQKKQKIAEKKQVFLDLEGESLQKAIKTVKKKGFKAKYYDEAEEDGKPTKFKDAPEIFTKTNKKHLFFITEVYDIDLKKKTVKFKFDSDEDALNEYLDEVKEELEEKLSPVKCLVMIEAYGKTQYPYGFKIKHFGYYNEEVYDENTWHISCAVEMGNMFGATMEGIADAYISGTTDEPVIESIEIR